MQICNYDVMMCTVGIAHSSTRISGSDSTASKLSGGGVGELIVGADPGRSVQYMAARFQWATDRGGLGHDGGLDWAAEGAEKDGILAVTQGLGFDIVIGAVGCLIHHHHIRNNNQSVVDLSIDPSVFRDSLRDSWFSRVDGCHVCAAAACMHACWLLLVDHRVRVRVDNIIGHIRA